jgi:hypothetical protein
MKVVYEYSHLGGSEIMIVRYPEILKQIYDVISSVTALKLKKSREKTMMDRMLYSPTNMNAQFRAAFYQRGFREVRDYYTITLPDYETVIPHAFKQVDFVKEKVLVEAQFGKYAYMFYDMAKFQYFFNESQADVGIEIVPCHALKKGMSSGVSFGEQLIYDIERLKRHFPAVPVKVILIDVDPENVEEVEQLPPEQPLEDQDSPES